MINITADDVRARGIRDVSFEPIAPGRSLIPLKASGSTPPVFLVHGGYGLVFHFKRLAERVRADIPLYGIQARGARDDREPAGSIPEMARDYVQELRDVQPQGPYLIGGFSFGGWVAWEMAQQLDAAGEDVRLLLIDIGPEGQEPASMNLLRTAGRIAAFHWRNWRGLEGASRSAYRTDAFRTEVMRISGFLGLDPTGRLYEWSMKIGRKPRGNQVGAMRSALAAMDDWKMQPFPRPVTLFRAELQPPQVPELETMGYTDELCPGGIEVRPIPGSHSFIFVEPHVNTLTVEFEAWVDRQQELTTGTAASVLAGGGSADGDR